MYTKLPKFALASAITLALASVSGAALAGDSTQAVNASDEVIEARLETRILTTYSLNSNLRTSDLDVTVDGDAATLTGTVAEESDSALARQIAMGVEGIKTVDNRIKVEAGYKPSATNTAERSFGEVVEDATITSSVKSKLLWGKSTEGMQMNVDTNRGKVSLKGDAQSEDSKELAGRIAGNTRGVKSVDNQLVVNPSTDKPAAERVYTDHGSEKANASSDHDMSEAVSDSWITTKVKSTFMYSSNVEGNDISASTKAGVVTLTGTVDSDSEKETAVELAQNVRGVKSVNAKALTF